MCDGGHEVDLTRSIISFELGHPGIYVITEDSSITSDDVFGGTTKRVPPYKSTISSLQEVLPSTLKNLSQDADPDDIRKAL